MSDGTTTNVLKGDLNDNENVQWLHDRYKEELLAFVDASVADAYQHRIHQEGIAETSFRQALDRFQKDPRYTRTSSAFRGLLYLIARREIADQIRIVRDPSQETSLDASVGDVFVDPDPLTPDQKSSLREEMRKSLAALIQETDLVRTLINVFGAGMELNASDIAEILKELPGQPRIPTPPTIRAQIERARERARKFRNDAQD